MTVPKYRIQATEIAKSDGMLKRDKKLDKGKSKVATTAFKGRKGMQQDY